MYALGFCIFFINIRNTLFVSKKGITCDMMCLYALQLQNGVSSFKWCFKQMSHYHQCDDMHIIALY